MAIELTGGLTELHDREWARLAAPGTWLSGAQRTGVARAARSGQAADSIEAAAVTIHDTPATITREWLARLEADGLTLFEYVEVLGIVARLRALDTMMFGLGQDLRPLPEPIDGDPRDAPLLDDTGATLDGGWVPTVGPAFPPNVLSSVPAENEAMHDLHGSLYLAPSGESEGFSMGNMLVVRDGLNRSQMEFVAARTSLLNDCFF